MAAQETTGKLAGRVALITGAGRGQGRALALALAREGAAIIACDFAGHLNTVAYTMNRANELDETVALVGAAGGEAIAARADIRDYGQMCAAADAGTRRFGRIDILCASAGSWASAPFHEMEEALWRETVDNNLMGTINSIRAVTPTMIAQRYGRIVATASAIAKRPQPGLAAYAAAKRGVLGLVDALSMELGRHNITVNALCPSVVRTGMTLNPAFAKSLRPDLPNPTFEDAAQVLGGLTRLGVPVAEVEDVTNAVLFLVSDAGRLITGVALDINPLL